MKKIGIIGGGQLARMMIPVAVNLNIDLKVLQENDGSPAALAATSTGDYKDLHAVLEFAKTVDVVSFDHEHVPGNIIDEIISNGVAAHPSPNALIYAQNKAKLRIKLNELNLPQPEWKITSDIHEINNFIAEQNKQVIAKTITGGYDGKGVRVISDAKDINDWLINKQEILLEEKIDFKYEASQLSARSITGEFKTWNLVKTIQQNGICAIVTAQKKFDNNQDKQLAKQAQELAETIAQELNITGVFAVELFVTPGNKLLINELAMRPHNSGHWSIEGSVTSQFEQHLRAVSSLPLGDTSLVSEYVTMVNIIGGPNNAALSDCYQKVMTEVPEAKIHNYNKQSRPGRKIGHITVCSENAEQGLARAVLAASICGSEVV